MGWDYPTATIGIGEFSLNTCVSPGHGSPGKDEAREWFRGEFIADASIWYEKGHGANEAIRFP
jgi:hypothetical protein